MMMMVVATAPLVLMFFCGALAVMMMSVMNFMMMFVRIFTMAFMMMFVRKFHFFHNFAILLVLYNQEHSVPFSISVAKLRKGFCNLVAKAPVALFFLPDSLTQSFGFLGKLRRNVKMIAHRDDILENEGHAVSSNDMPLFLYSLFTISQSKIPLPSSSSSMPKPTTFRLSALKGSRYWRS